MSIASHFRSKMDVALNSADQSRGLRPDARRARLQIELDREDLMIVEKSMVAALMEKAQAAGAQHG